MKNTLLIIAAFTALCACSSNYNKNATPTQTLPAEVNKQAVRTTVDPQPGINEHVNNLGRNAAVIHSIPDPQHPNARP